MKDGDKPLIEKSKVKNGKVQIEEEYEYGYEYYDEEISDCVSDSNESVHTKWDTPSDSHWLPEDLEFKYILRMVYCLFFSNLLLNMDNGILPAGSLDFKEEMGLGNTGFGTLGSCVYLG